jgi:hypothetical protein
MLLYGPRYLTPEERERRLGWWLRRYGVFLGKAVVQGKFREPKFREVHGETVSMLRTSLSLGDLARACLADPVPRRPSLTLGHASPAAVEGQHSSTVGP